MVFSWCTFLSTLDFLGVIPTKRGSILCLGTTGFPALAGMTTLVNGDMLATFPSLGTLYEETDCSAPFWR